MMTAESILIEMKKRNWMDTFLCTLVQKRLTNRIFFQRQKTLYTNEKVQAKKLNKTEQKKRHI